MRTTIELDNEHRARLLDLAARRGLKGFSAIVQEALDQYLDRASAKARAGSSVQRFRGCLSKAEADHFRSVTRAVSTPVST